MHGPWEVVGNPTEGYRVRNKHTGRHSTATPTHSLADAAKERDRLNVPGAHVIEARSRTDPPQHTFTPGPWETSVYCDGTQWEVCTEGGGDAVARMVPQRDAPHEEEANAHLIAAAPELLTACEAALLRDDVADCELGAQLRAAIAKARGGEA